MTEKASDVMFLEQAAATAPHYQAAGLLASEILHCFARGQSTGFCHFFNF
jgi:hypothetical protein